MAYITYQQYLDLYGTCPISEEEFPVYAGLASDMIDSITRYRIVEGRGNLRPPVYTSNAGSKGCRGTSAILHTNRTGNRADGPGRPVFYGGKGFSIGRRIVQYNHKARRSDGQPFRAFLA